MPTADLVETSDTQAAADRAAVSVRPRTSGISERAVMRRSAAVLLVTSGLCIIYLGYATIIRYYWLVVHSAVCLFCQLCSIQGSGDVASLSGLTSCVIVVTTVYLVYGLGGEEKCARPSRRVRSWRVWKVISDFFPVNLVLSEELLEYSREVTGGKRHVVDEELGKDFCGLPGDKNYLIGIHPHGVCAFSAFFNFATEATGISQAFPNLTIYLAVWPPLSRLPGLKKLTKYLGIISVSKQSLLKVLNRPTGNLVTVVVGGGPEMHEAHPRKYNLFLKRRHGFFKLALQTGSHLIPCISFGELNTVKHVANPPHSWLRRFQNWVVDRSERQFACPIAYGYGPLPIAAPLNTVVGAPIECEKVENPTVEQVLEVKRCYMKALTDLYNQYKPKFDPQAENIRFV